MFFLAVYSVYIVLAASQSPLSFAFIFRVESYESEKLSQCHNNISTNLQSNRLTRVEHLPVVRPHTLLLQLSQEYSISIEISIISVAVTKGIGESTPQATRPLPSLSPGPRTDHHRSSAKAASTQYTRSSLHPTTMQLSTTTGDEKTSQGNSCEPMTVPANSSTM